MTHRTTDSWLMDMDGVLVSEEIAIPGAERFIARLRELGRPRTYSFERITQGRSG